MKRLAALALLTTGMALCACPADPIDPLVRDQDRPGAYRWHLGLGYTPAGERGHAIDTYGVPYEYTKLMHGVTLSLSGELSINPMWKAGVEISDTTWLMREQRVYTHHTFTEESAAREFSYSLVGETRLAPASHLDPTVTLSVGHPRLRAIEASVNLLRDPVALLGQLGYARHAVSPRETLSFSIACAFVANAWITLGASASWDIPLDEPSFPAAAVSILLQHDLELTGKLQIKAHITMHIVENSPLLGVTLELGGRGG